MPSPTNWQTTNGDALTGTTNIDTILTQEANRIGQDIHRRTLHVSPWMDLIKQTPFPEGMGYKLGTLIYDRALPVTTSNGTTLASSSWTEVGADVVGSLVTGSSKDQLITGAVDTVLGPQDGRSFIHFTRQLKQYSLQRAIVESPRINIEDLRFAAYRTEQLRAVMDALTESTRYTWEQRYRDQYDVVCDNYVKCTDASVVTTGFEGTSSESLDWGASDANLPTRNISNKVMDTVYFRSIRAGAGTNAYGRENARAVLGVVLSSEASYALQIESGFRDDVRYNQSRVSELIAPLGVEKSFRGYYHLVDDMAPRYKVSGSDNGTWVRVHPYKVNATTGAIELDLDYENPAVAKYETAYVLHSDVMESQIPDPVSGSNGLTFDPVNYRGKFAWKNIPSVDLNPDGTIGFFRGTLASASKPIRTEFGYAIHYDRTAAPAS
jgi:hypothetical protein